MTVRESQPGDQALIIGMRADPEPDDLVSFTDAKSAVITGHPCRINGPVGVNLLEPKAWMIGVAYEEPVCLSSLTLNMLRQIGECPAE